MLPGGVRRLVDDWSLKPGERAVVARRRTTRGARAAPISSAPGVEIAAVIDLRSSGEPARRDGREGGT